MPSRAMGEETEREGGMMSESLINRLIDMHKQIFLYGKWLLELRYQVLQQKEENIRLRSERDTAKKELEELKAKLPKTADGVLILPDDVTVCGEYPHFPNTWDMRTIDGRRISEHNELQYSSWEAAEQAAREAGEGGNGIVKNIPE